MKTLYGLIGYPLGHSFSERYFEEKFRLEGIHDTGYRSFPIDSIDRLPALLIANPTLRGINVTIPYKEQVLPYLACIDPEAAKIGAVNCIKIDGDKLVGYNTDVYGFRGALLELIGDTRPSAALILGTGGASKAVKYVLGQLGITYTEASRSKKNGALSYGEIDSRILSQHKLIINTTPLGTFPNIDNAPELPYGSLTTDHYLFDLVYNPAETLFLKQGRERGAKTMNGYGMLVGQAERSWQIWQAKY